MQNDGRNTVTGVNTLGHISGTVPAYIKLTRGNFEVEGHKHLRATEVKTSERHLFWTVLAPSVFVSLSVFPLSFSACPFQTPCP